MPFYRNFATYFYTSIIYHTKMSKTKYQETATNYAREYLKKLLKIEDSLSYDLDNRIKEDARKIDRKEAGKPIKK